MSKNQLKAWRLLAKEYCEQWPSVANQTLARKLYAEHKAAFSGLDMARNAIRYFRGAQGSRNRKHTSTKDTQKPLGWQAQLPQSVAEPTEPFVLDVRGKAGLILCDVHVPYHDEAALRIAMQTAIDHGAADFVLLNGDILDCYMLSVYEKNPDSRRFVDEMSDGRRLLDAVRAAFPSARIIYKLGNHENRYERYLMRKAPELFNVDEFKLSHHLRFSDTGTEGVEHYRPIHVGDHLTILHGHETRVSSPVNPARGAFLKSHACTIIGHLHQTSQHTEKDVRQKFISSWSVGCLCELTGQDYARMNKWNHGFALLEVDSQNFYVVHNKRIVNGKVV